MLKKFIINYNLNSSIDVLNQSRLKLYRYYNINCEGLTISHFNNLNPNY